MQSVEKHGILKVKKKPSGIRIIRKDFALNRTVS
jgi:hypothetical protein